jgi:quercetin dioxygenase-like cupin family protein
VKVKQSQDVPATDVDVDGASGVRLQWLIAHADEPENFCMRLFELAPGGHTPLHGHPWEHEVFVLAGQGRIVTPQGERELAPYSVVYVPPQQEHQFRNIGAAPFKFLCMVPKAARY